MNLIITTHCECGRHAETGEYTLAVLDWPIQWVCPKCGKPNVFVFLRHKFFMITLGAHYKDIQIHTDKPFGFGVGSSINISEIDADLLEEYNIQFQKALQNAKDNKPKP